MKKDTSWEKHSRWYDEHLKGGDTYQEKVILPNLLRMLNLRGTEVVLDLACGQGYFARELAMKARVVTGSDLSKSLIAQARREVKGAAFYVADAAKLSFAKDDSFDIVVCVLALQNIEKLQEVFKEVRRVLKKNGRLLFVLNHPAFRVLKRSSWGFDEKTKEQYRRVDGYLTPSKVKVEMHPGKDSSYTVSFHRSLQDFMKPLLSAGLTLTRLEEWISHRTSEKGPRAEAEDRARKEIPLFLALEARK